MNIKVELLNKAQLEIVKHYFIVQISKNLETIDFIDYYNALKVCKKMQDVIFTRTINPTPKKIKFTLELNQFYTFVQIIYLGGEIVEPYADVLCRDIIESGHKQTQQIQHQHYIKKLMRDEIL